MGGQRHVSAFLPPIKTRYPLYRRLRTPQGFPGRVRKTSSPPGFDPRTVQPIASRCTDWAIPAHKPQYSVKTFRLCHFVYHHTWTALNSEEPLAARLSGAAFKPTLWTLNKRNLGLSFTKRLMLSSKEVTNNVKMYEICTSKYLHIVLSILFSVYNLTMANWGPKHVVVIAFLPTLFN